MKNHVTFALNGELHTLSGEKAFITLSDFLRYHRGLTGTKVVCAEGDCGACTVLVSRMNDGKLSDYESINSCIAFMWQLDGAHIVSVEGLKKDGKLHPVQESMASCHGAQCGYCTPGFICAMAQMTDEAKVKGATLSEKNVKNALTGNLCRCTGYQAIIEAGVSVDLKKVEPLHKMYPSAGLEEKLQARESVLLSHEGMEISLPRTIDEALRMMNDQTKVVSGATDLGVLFNKGKWTPQKMLSLMHIDELKKISDEPDALVVGARASLHAVEFASKKYFPEFSKLLHVFASPQIKNSGTLVGNMMNASPIADTIPFLKVAEAEVILRSLHGERRVNVNDFFKPGYKQMDLRPGELVTHVRIPKTRDQFKLYKVSKRKDLDISAVTCAIRYDLKAGSFQRFSLAFGGVAASVLRFPTLEAKAQGQKPTVKLFTDLGIELNQLITPVSDVRGSSDYRRLLCKNLLLKFASEHAEASV